MQIVRKSAWYAMAPIHPRSRCQQWLRPMKQMYANMLEKYSDAGAGIVVRVALDGDGWEIEVGG